MSPLKAKNSYWMQSVPPTSYPALQGEVTVDVCIMGAGIAGLLTAFELSKSGLRVTGLESGDLASAVIGYTMAKLTSQHGPRYLGLAQEQGPEVASSYAQANQDGLQRIRHIAAELQSYDAMHARDAYVYGTEPSSVAALRGEAQPAVDAGSAP
jgi:glycine/D-amino acid oxidase-like deaminating enzyme